MRARSWPEWVPAAPALFLTPGDISNGFIEVDEVAIYGSLGLKGSLNGTHFGGSNNAIIYIYIL